MNKSTLEEDFPNLKFWDNEDEVTSQENEMRSQVREMVEELMLTQASQPKKKRKHGKKKHMEDHWQAPMPIAIFHGNSINFGSIGIPRKSHAASNNEQLTSIIQHYERILAQKDLKIRDLESDLEIFMPVRDDWKEAV